MKTQLTRIFLLLAALTMTISVWAQSYPATDSFSGSGALSASWTNTTPGGLSYPNVPLVRSSGTVIPSTTPLPTSSWGIAVYTGTTFTNDQYAQAVFVTHNSAGGWTGPCVRMSATAYGYCYMGDSGQIGLTYDGQWNASIVSTCPIPASGDTIKISAVGTTFTCTDVTTGVSASGTDSTWWVGALPGLAVDKRNSTVYALTSFQADCIPTCAPGAATPTFSPAAGSYASAQTVTISSSTSGATIHYTTDGSTPTATSATYSTPIAVVVSETVKAIAVKAGYVNSAIGSAAYTITSSYPVADNFSGSGALSGNWTNTTPGGLSYPNVPLVRSSSTVIPSTTPLPTSSWGIAVYTGTTFTNDQYAQAVFITHNSAGGWTGPCVRMSVGAYGYCYMGDNGQIGLTYDGQWNASIVSTCPIPSSGDTIKISAVGSTITCTDVTTGVSASGTDTTWWVGALPGLAVDRRNSTVYALTSFQADCIPSCTGSTTVATPGFTPVAGTYSSTQTVTITDATPGAVIHYTVDGSTPTAGSTTYSSAITVSASQTIKAIGVKTGYTNSAVGSAAYVITATVATPTFSPAAGSYTSAQTVTISSATSGATIYYTTNGANPTTSSTVYSSPISVATSETVKAFAVKTGSTNSAIGSATYTITIGGGQTWYVRPDGGTRYTTNITIGQCNGKYDAAYPGSGTNQNCAFNDVRMLYSDGSYSYGDTFPGWGWVIAGGDTVIIRGSIGTGVSYRIGWNSGTYCDATGCWGLTGNSAASGMPAPPSGTSARHTRILGENYASCSSQSSRTQLHGGWGVGGVMSFGGASYVDVSCFDITDFSNCGRATDTIGCDTTQDFAHNGLQFSNTSTHITLNNIRLHGLADSGIVGSTGDGFVAVGLDILGNAGAGWNADGGDGTTGVGSFLVQNFNISWNGCVEEYPIVHTLPYFSCTDQNTGGYGDGFGTATVASPSPGWQVHFDQGIVSYNTQDGLDALHISGPGSTMTVTRVLAYGSQGQQIKVGGATATVQNSVIYGNCEAMSTQAIPGTPTGFGANATGCRAGNVAVLINVTPGDPATFQDNTIVSEGAIGLEVEYATGDTGSTNTLKYNNNIFLGFTNAGNSENPTPIYSNTDLNMLTNAGASWTHNAYYGYRSNWTCPSSGESSALCTNPGLVDQTYHPYGYGNVAPASGSSAVVGAGVAVTGLTTDYKGTTRGTPPTIGACEATGTCP